MTHAQTSNPISTAKDLVNASQAMADAYSLNGHKAKTHNDRNPWTQKQLIHMSRSLGHALGSPQ